MIHKIVVHAYTILIAQKLFKFDYLRFGSILFDVKTRTESKLDKQTCFILRCG